MNILDFETNNIANREAVFCVYTYIAYRGEPKDGDSFAEALGRIDEALLDSREKKQLKLIKDAVYRDFELARYSIAEHRISEGLKAFAFKSANNISVVFRGTSPVEWIDNGLGLSGISSDSTYYTFGEDGEVLYANTVKDLATYRQAEALNWFEMICARNGWGKDHVITVSGHSKGGNKAQFIAVNSDKVDLCVSFDGQGFSPEAISYFREKLGEVFDERQKKIISVCAYNDYINILGDSLLRSENVFYLDAPVGEDEPEAFHRIEAILDDDGGLHGAREQGEMSIQLSKIAREVMRLDPGIRNYATVGISSAAGKITGGERIMSDDIRGNIITGVGLILEPFVANIFGNRDGYKEGYEAILQIARMYGTRSTSDTGYQKKPASPSSYVETAVSAAAVVAYTAPFAKKQGLPEPEKTKDMLSRALKKIDRSLYDDISPLLQ